MNLKAEKKKLIEWINSLDDETTIEKIKLVRDTSDDEWKSGLSSLEIEAIEEGLADIEAGRTTPHEEVRKRYEKWL
jgi:predicted transcriptional regulator